MAVPCVDLEWLPEPGGNELAHGDEAEDGELFEKTDLGSTFPFSFFKLSFRRNFDEFCMLHFVVLCNDCNDVMTHDT